MQPPQFSPYLLDGLRRLREKAITQAERAESQIAQTDTAKQQRQQTDFVQLVREWYEAIPPAARARRYTTEELLNTFKGRYSARPSTRMIAAALVANGFTPHRDWTRAGRNRRYWLGPQR